MEKKKGTIQEGENTLPCKPHKELLSQQQKDQKKVFEKLGKGSEYTSL